MRRVVLFNKYTNKYLGRIEGKEYLHPVDNIFLATTFDKEVNLRTNRDWTWFAAYEEAVVQIPEPEPLLEAVYGTQV